MQGGWLGERCGSVDRTHGRADENDLKSQVKNRPRTQNSREMATHKHDNALRCTPIEAWRSPDRGNCRWRNPCRTQHDQIRVSSSQDAPKTSENVSQAHVSLPPLVWVSRALPGPRYVHAAAPTPRSLTSPAHTQSTPRCAGSPSHQISTLQSS